MRRSTLLFVVSLIVALLALAIGAARSGAAAPPAPARPAPAMSAEFDEVLFLSGGEPLSVMVQVRATTAEVVVRHTREDGPERLLSAVVPVRPERLVRLRAAVAALVREPAPATLGGPDDAARFQLEVRRAGRVVWATTGVEGHEGPWAARIQAVRDVAGDVLLDAADDDAPGGGLLGR